MEGHENLTFSSMEKEFNATSKFHYTGNLESVFSATRLFYAAALMEFYYTPILCLLGTIGNSLSISVFCFNPSQRNLSSSYYLSALAISDTGFLITLFILWLENLGAGILTSKLGCPFIMFSGQVTCFLSVWLMVAFTVERWFCVCFPLRRSSICTVSKAKKVIAGLTIFALVAFSYALFIARVEESNVGNDDYLAQNHSNNGSIPTHNHSLQNSVIEQDLRNENIMPLELYLSTNSLKSNPLGREDSGCLDGESCQHQFPRGAQNDLNISFNSALRNAEGLQSFDDNEDDEIESSLLTTMFNSTRAINLNDGDIYEQRESSNTATNEVRCTVPMKYMTISIVANYLDSTFTLIVPFIIISYLNFRIAVCIWKLKDERKLIVANCGKVNQQTNLHSSPPQAQSVQSVGYKSNFQRITKPSKNTDKNRVEETQQFHTKSQQQKCVIELAASDTNLEESLQAQANEYGQKNNDDIFSSHLNGKGSATSLCERSDIRANCKTDSQKFTEKIMSKSDTSINKSTNVLYPQFGKFGETINKGKAEKVGTFNSRPKFIKNNKTSNKLNISEVTNHKTNCKVANTPISSHSSETRVTKMLLLVSTVFLALNLPSHAIRLASFFQSFLWKNDQEEQLRLHSLNMLCNILLFNTNFAVNFLLYCLSGRNFRKSLRSVLFGRCHKNATRSPKPKPNSNIPVTKRGNIRFAPETVQVANNEMDLVEYSAPFHNRKEKQHPINSVLYDSESIEMESTVA